MMSLEVVGGCHNSECSHQYIHTTLTQASGSMSPENRNKSNYRCNYYKWYRYGVYYYLVSPNPESKKLYPTHSPTTTPNLMARRQDNRGHVSSLPPSVLPLSSPSKPVLPPLPRFELSPAQKAVATVNVPINIFMLLL